MQALIELIAGFIALLAAAALSQFGVDMNAPQSSDREVHRVQDRVRDDTQDCRDASSAAVHADISSPHC